MYHKKPIIQVKKSDNDGFTVITITGPGAEEIAEKVRGIFEEKETKCGCFVDFIEIGESEAVYDYCFLDVGEDCSYKFSDGVKPEKKTCKYWRPINQKSKEV